jgi:hypothetical protein
MRLNRFFLVFALIVLFLVGLLVVWQRKGPSPGVTLGNFNRLHKGMTEKEVEAIMGPGEMRGTVSFSHFIIWSNSHSSVIISFSDISIDGINVRATKGDISIEGGGTLDLREEPLGFYKWMTNFFKKLLPSFAK